MFFPKRRFYCCSNNLNSIDDMLRRLPVLVLIFGLMTTSLIAQNGTLIGLVGHQLVRVNTETAALTPWVSINAVAGSEELRNLIYVPADTCFYTIADFRNEPKLARISLRGELSYVGALNVPGQSVYFCEALTRDPATGKVYAAASLDGSISTDRMSEALLEVDLRTANCSVVASLYGRRPGNDIDEMAIFNGQVHIFDCDPGYKTSFFFPFELEGLEGEVRAGSMQNLPYLTMDDVVVISNRIYFPHAFDRFFYYYDLRTRRLNTVGRLDYSAFSGDVKLTGLAVVPFPQA